MNNKADYKLIDISKNTRQWIVYKYNNNYEHTLYRMNNRKFTIYMLSGLQSTFAKIRRLTGRGIKPVAMISAYCIFIVSFSKTFLDNASLSLYWSEVRVSGKSGVRNRVHINERLDRDPDEGWGQCCAVWSNCRTIQCNMAPISQH